MAVRKNASRTTLSLVKAWLWGILVGILAFVLLLSGRSLLAFPTDVFTTALVRFATALSRPWVALQHFSQRLFHAEALQQELLQARAQMARWLAEQERLQRLEEENQRLRQLLGLSRSLDHPYVAAEVIAIGGSNWFHTVIINKGERDGIRQGAPVLCHRGLVGRIWEVKTHHSIVLLLTDRHSAVSVALSEHPNTYGIVKGTGRRWCELTHLSRHVVPRKGEKLVTSGLGGVFPKGIPVGEVLSINTATEPPTVRVRPFTRVTELREVIVLTDLPPPVIP